VSLTRIGRVFREARSNLSDAEQALVGRPYDLRHACVSTWLAAGADTTVVAEWAGHSIKVLLDVYAHAVEGRDQVARDKITNALGSAELSRDSARSGAEGEP
jgi:integrase